MKTIDVKNNNRSGKDTMNPFKYDWSGWNIIAIFVVSASLANVRIVVGEEEKSMTNEFSLSRSLQNNVTSIVEEIFNDLNLPFNESIITDVCDLSQINCTEGIMKQFIIPFDTAIGTIPTKIGLLSTLEEFSIGMFLCWYQMRIIFVIKFYSLTHY